MPANRQPAPGLLLCLLVSVAFYVYLPGANGPFVIDDFPNIVENNYLVLQELSLDSLREAALSSPASRFHRPLAMLSLAANFTLAGGKSELSAKFTNILLHLLCGLGVYLLTRLLLSRFNNRALIPDTNPQLCVAALFAAAIFLLHPLYVSTVLYAVQRMAIMSNLFMIYGCLCYLQLRIRSLKHGRALPGLLVASALFTLLGFLCKENGALLPGFLLIIELFCFNFRFHPQAHPRSRQFLGAFLILPVAAISGYLLSAILLHTGEPLPPYGFTAWQRLLTETRVLWSYAGWLTFLNPERMGIYHDDLPVSTGLINPWTTLPAVVGWLVVIALCAARWRSRSIVIFCVLWFLWGHSLESTVLPLAPMFEHRNYQPGLGLLLLFVLLIRHAVGTLVRNNYLRDCLCLVIFVLLPLYTLQARVNDWHDRKSLTLALLRDKPDSAQSLVMAAQYLLDAGNFSDAAKAIIEAQRLEPAEPSHFLAEASIHCHSAGQKEFKFELKEKLAQIQPDTTPTVNTLRQLRQLTSHCQGSDPNLGTLLTLYERLGHHPDARLSMLALYGSGAIYMRRSQYSEAVRAWEAAMARHADAAGLKPALEWARKQIRQGDH